MQLYWCCLLFIPYLSDAQKQATTNDWVNLEKYTAENKALKPPVRGEKRVVFIGNSITEHWKIKDRDFFVDNHYINRGISGETTRQIRARFRADAIELQPTVIIILAGINDIAGYDGWVPVDSIFANIVAMAQMAMNENIRVVLCSVLPANKIIGRPDIQPIEKIIALNARIKRFCREHQLVYADYYSAMVDEHRGLDKRYSSDGIHPNFNGYRVMNPIIRKAIAETLRGK